MSRLVPVGVAVCVAAGLILWDFSGGPAHHLVRPLVAGAGLAVAAGLAASLVGPRASGLVAAFVVATILQIGSVVAITVSLLLAVGVWWRLLRGQAPDAEKPVAAAAIVFLVTGIIAVAPKVIWIPSVPDDPVGASPPVFLVLLDGYPRVDTLAGLGVDISVFVSELEARGFDYYPNATSHHSWTWRTLTHMFTGEPMDSDEYGEPAERRAAIDLWRLPEGFVTIHSGWGETTIPGSPILNPGGPTGFEHKLVRKSLVGRWAADYVMDGLRFQLERSLRTLASTDHTMVFAHLLAPHVPFLYDEAGSPLPLESNCWPECTVLDITPHLVGITQSEWASGIAGYLSWLNPRLLEVADSLIAQHPDAEIVFFSDHGGRFDWDRREEWHRVFLAARTSTPGLFEDAPHPSSVLTRLDLEALLVPRRLAADYAFAFPGTKAR